MQRCDAEADAGTRVGMGRGGRDQWRCRGALGAGAVSRPGSPEGAPMRAADAVSRDGRGGAGQEGRRTVGTAGAGGGAGREGRVCERARATGGRQDAGASAGAGAGAGMGWGHDGRGYARRRARWCGSAGGTLAWER